MGNCMRCGRETSGQYCESCRFYETNDQCWRCRMYLPKVELQQWRGQTFCPYCIMDVREEEARSREHKEEQKRQEEKGEGVFQPGTSGGSGGEPGFPPEEAPSGQAQKNLDYDCDRCKGDLDIVYIVADHKFCELCFNQQQREWKKTNIKQMPYMKYRVKDDPGLFSRLIRYLKHYIRERWEKRKRERKDGAGGKEKGGKKEN